MLKDKKRLVAVILGVLIIGLTLFLIFRDKEDNSLVLNNDVNKPDETINTEYNNELYSLITDVNCDYTMVFDFGDKKEISVSDFSKEQRLNLIFRYLEVNNKLNEDISKSDFENAVIKTFGKELKVDFNIKNFSYKDKIWNTDGKVIESKSGNKCTKSNIVAKNFSYTLNEVGIELGTKDGNKLYNMNNELVGEYTNDKELNLLLDKSTAYYYKYEFNGENPYLVKVIPIVKVVGIK